MDELVPIDKRTKQFAIRIHHCDFGGVCKDGERRKMNSTLFHFSFLLFTFPFSLFLFTSLISSSLFHFSLSLFTFLSFSTACRFAKALGMDFIPTLAPIKIEEGE